ncbi:MAG: DUF1801 domain-containing protein [Bryobacteraceae bacterium]|nr:DUF1801 domain-containing protein [Solibacteraceae bacterium]MCO5353591.1 DUF1801 domain-containing protein [Bryobacteraceae bacterium]
MAELKTKQTQASVSAFLDAVENEQRRADCRTVLNLMRAVTGEEPKMWGPSMVGFGSYHYKYASGREGDWFVTGFSPRKQDLTLYIMAGFDRYDELMAKLGKYKTGKSCLYLKRLSDVDLGVLRELVAASVEAMRQGHRCG